MVMERMECTIEIGILDIKPGWDMLVIDLLGMNPDQRWDVFLELVRRYPRSFPASALSLFGIEPYPLLTEQHP